MRVPWRTAVAKGRIHVLVNYETTWYASNHAAYKMVVKTEQSVISGGSSCMTDTADRRRLAASPSFSSGSPILCSMAVVR